MRRVDRNSVTAPASLTTPSAAVARERANAAAYYATGAAAAFKFGKYRDFEVKAALLELFDDKCAYCELELGDSLNVEHFRPKGKVEDEPTHRGYWWLASTWENLLPSCVGCNQRRSQYLVTITTTDAEFAAFRRKKVDGDCGEGQSLPNIRQPRFQCE